MVAPSTISYIRGVISKASLIVRQISASLIFSLSVLKSSLCVLWWILCIGSFIYLLH